MEQQERAYIQKIEQADKDYFHERVRIEREMDRVQEARNRSIESLGNILSRLNHTLDKYEERYAPPVQQAYYEVSYAQDECERLTKQVIIQLEEQEDEAALRHKRQVNDYEEAIYQLKKKGTNVNE